MSGPLTLLNTSTTVVNAALTDDVGSLQTTEYRGKHTTQLTEVVTPGLTSTVAELDISKFQYLCVQISSDSNNSSTIKIETSPDKINWYLEDILFNNSGTYQLDRRIGSNYISIVLANFEATDQTYKVSVIRSN